MRNAAHILAALALVTLLAGCEDAPPTTTVADFEKQRAEASARQATQTAKGKPKEKGAAAAGPSTARTDYGASDSPNYRYDATGKRDPFRSFVKDELHADALDVQSPLEQFELGQLTVSGVVWQADRRRALVLDPSGQAYVVKTGDRMGKNDGVVTQIGDSSLVVLEAYVDFHGDKTEKEIEMRIRQSTGG
jgi:type IV pilus assembly protein PilP